MLCATITAHRSRLGCIGKCHHGRRLGRQRCVSAGVYAFESLDTEHCVTIGGRIMARCSVGVLFKLFQGSACIIFSASKSYLRFVSAAHLPSSFVTVAQASASPSPLSLLALHLSSRRGVLLAKQKRRRQLLPPPAAAAAYNDTTRKSQRFCTLLPRFESHPQSLFAVSQSRCDNANQKEVRCRRAMRHGWTARNVGRLLMEALVTEPGGNMIIWESGLMRKRKHVTGKDRL